MSFFGFDQPNDFEEEKRKILQGGYKGLDDVAVYTWGEESYDGLGDALQEGGDELNDETFGAVGDVGKDFDFAGHALPGDGYPKAHDLPRSREPTQPISHQTYSQAAAASSNSRPTSRPAHSLESIWENKSPFSVLPKMNGSSPRPVEHHHHHPPAPATSGFSPFGNDIDQPTGPTRQQQQHQQHQQQQQQPITLSLGANQTHGVRTLEEIEAEMREAFAAQRLQNESPSQAQRYQQSQLQQQTQAQLQQQQAQIQQAQLRSVGHRHTPSHYGQTPTPPPRMHAHAQSPRFQQQHQQQQIHLLQQQQQLQLLELQELRERQQQQQLLELQEQLKLEEMERQRQAQVRAQQNAQQQYLLHQRQASSGTPHNDMQYRRQGARVGTPSRLHQPAPSEVPFQQNLQYLPREIQFQQKLLAEMAQAEFIRSLQGSPVNRDSVEGQGQEVQEMLRLQAMRKIMEAEKMEEKRKRKLEKIRHMSRYNDLMTQSDKDFITRIQVSQLVTQDPYSEDYYAQVFSRMLHNRLGVNAPDHVLKFGSGGGVGLGLASVKGHRRQSAMQRMEQQVERIVTNARLREKEKITLNNLQGALGKTAGRSYKAAPRQLLQVDAADVQPGSSGASTTQKAAEIGHEALATSDGRLFPKRDPLTHRETLVVLERIFDDLMELDRMKEERMVAEDMELDMQDLNARFTTVAERLFDNLKIGVPLETCIPHPFISLITPIKGKKMLPRALRYIDPKKHLTVMTLILACFSQLDVVRNARLLDSLEDTQERRDAEQQLDAFIHHVMHALLPVAATAGVNLIRGLVGVMMTRNNIVEVARTRAGIFVLTMFISRIEQLNQEGWAFNAEDAPTPEDVQEWQDIFNQLFATLAPEMVYLFPSVRQSTINGIPITNIPDIDDIDQPTWQFLAILAAHADVEQHQILVTILRDRVLDSVKSAAKGWNITSEEQREKRLANVNIFLNALGLDASQIVDNM